jgi:hypothetical protein
MEWYFFERSVLAKNKIFLEKIIEKIDSPGDYSKNELQAFFEIQSLLFVFLNYKDFLNSHFQDVFEKRLTNNAAYLDLLSLINDWISRKKLSLNSEIICNQLLMSFLLQVLNNKLISYSDVNSKNEWYSSYDVFDEFCKKIKAFFIFMEQDLGVKSLSDEVDQRKLIMSVINSCVNLDILLKKTETSDFNKKAVFYCLKKKP